MVIVQSGLEGVGLGVRGGVAMVLWVLQVLVLVLVQAVLLLLLLLGQLLAGQ